MTKPQILWLRRDLRLRDNPALTAALAQGPVIPVYVLDDARAKHHVYGGASRWWLHHSLESLSRDLGKHNVRLILRRGDTVEQLREIASEVGATIVHAIRHYEPWWRQAHRELRERLDLQLYDGNYLLPIGAVTTGSGAPYKIYTPFSKAVLEQMPPREELPAPEHFTLPDSWPASDDLADWDLFPTKPDWAGGIAEAWDVGEQAALDRLDWWEDHVAEYDEDRNLPSIDGSSRLSPHLHFGEISPVQIWHRLTRRRGENALKQRSVSAYKEGLATFAKELIWRDYAQNVICQFPDYPVRSYREQFEHFSWRDPETDEHAAADLKAWQQGRTGYPIVDAGMRQLWQTGWMHNRVRMIAASFLIKHLLIDWRHGERWFWDTLVDADYGSNGANWQWVAGSGVDSNMFVRIMAPLSQSEKFDAAGYIREYVPELAELSDADIHDPEGLLRPSGYPKILIGHREARERALAAWRAL